MLIKSQMLVTSWGSHNRITLKCLLVRKNIRIVLFVLFFLYTVYPVVPVVPVGSFTVLYSRSNRSLFENVRKQNCQMAKWPNCQMAKLPDTEISTQVKIDLKIEIGFDAETCCCLECQTLKRRIKFFCFEADLQKKNCKIQSWKVIDSWKSIPIEKKLFYFQRTFCDIILLLLLKLLLLL